MTPFHRYDSVAEDSAVRMPEDLLDARVSAVSIAEVLGRFERFTSGDKYEGPAMYPWASRFVMGFPLPEWQRPLVWLPEQKVRFIQSIWAGVDIGSYMLNESYEYEDDAAGVPRFRKFSEVLLDGQQRLSAIEAYVLNEFAVPDFDGVPRFWRELPKVERRRFSSLHFARATVKSWDERKLRLAYDLRAFGGTPHTEAQRALGE